MGTLDIKNPEFWDLGAVDRELRRVYDICGGCRRCLPLCPSFKVLFDRMDVEAVDGDVEKLPAADVKEVVDLCYQCKLCFNHCPYTPPHRWEVDFPRLMLRARAAETRRRGVTLQDRLLGNADLVGRLGSLGAPLSNWMNELGVHRAFMQAVAGIHRRRNLPKFNRRTFSAWFKSRPAAPASPASRDAKPPRKVALFHTCSVEYYEPATGRAAVRVLERNRVDVRVPPQRCCGMPYLDGGAVDEAKALIRDNVKSLAAAVREGCEIVVPGPTCSYMLKQEYPWLDSSEDAKLVAENTRDLFEYLARLQAAGELDTNFTRPGGAVTYHVPCHLRAQNIGHKSADVLRAIPGASVNAVEKCSAVDGTWGFKQEYYELSLQVAKPLFDAITGAGAPTAATDCPLAALQIEQGTGKKPKHPIEVLASAYGLEE
ncbi:MAG: anaerobic glycerol-3-phosphate dehydrogenase subunit C [Candidatus Rokuibacteriota bacterium]|nr:MAG: anaerobic glycerol-3-phosphate dehydrogenase subunit C [Candidatus Rokubacteria bacterium]